MAKLGYFERATYILKVTYIILGANLTVVIFEGSKKIFNCSLEVSLLGFHKSEILIVSHITR